MFLFGLVIFGVASLAAAFSPTASLLIAARAFLAVGAAAMMPATLALIRITFDNERERNIAIAVWGSVGSGRCARPDHRRPAAVAFLVGFGVPAQRAGGRAGLHRHPGVRAQRNGRERQTLGSVVLDPGSVDPVRPRRRHQEVAHAGPSWPLAGAALAVAAAGGWLFVRRQARLRSPLLDFKIFRKPAFSAGVLAAAFAMFTIGGMQLVTTQRFQLVAGFTPLQAGLLVRQWR